jgi:CubicO group peptidase (beta-lactamase class C family)
VKRLAQWAAVAIVVVCMLIAARQPEYWKRYVVSLLHGGSDLPLSFYEPRELVEGGNMPPAPRVAPALESLDAAALQAAADYAAGFDSHALIVTRHGHIAFERYWHGTDFNTLESSQSFVRVLTALLTGVAISERKIGWPDEPIGYILPEWSHDPRGAITVRNLLQMSSGLQPAGAPARLGTDIAARHLQQPLVSRPGATWADQPADVQLLARVIERATHQRFAQYLSEGLWRRLGAADAWLWLDRTGGTAHADCCMLARQGDWIRLGELLANNGRYQGDEIVAPGWVAQLLAPVKGNPSYGSFLRVKAGKMAESFAAADVFMVESAGHRMWLVPSMELVILRTGPTLGSPWDDSRIPNLIIRGARDYVPARARPGVDLRSLVPNH